MGKNQEGGCLNSGEKQQQTEQDTELIEFLGKGVELFRVELSRVEIVEISCPEIALFTLYDGGRVHQ